MNTFYKKQLIGLIITALALQGVLSLLGAWGLYGFQPIFMWAVRVFLILELVFLIYHFTKNSHKPLPWIGRFAERIL